MPLSLLIDFYKLSVHVYYLSMCNSSPKHFVFEVQISLEESLLFRNSSYYKFMFFNSVCVHNFQLSHSDFDDIIV